LVFEKNANFSPKIGENRRKLAKIAENCDHNIDPRGQGYDFLTAINIGDFD
jgi:hypothetical protein